MATGAPSEEVRRIAEESLRTEANDIKIELNDAVLSCIDLYQGPLRDWFTEALARAGATSADPQVFQSEGIPQDLAYVALVESAFKTALSRSKAKGVWQFMPGTGKRFGLKQDYRWIDERSNPERPPAPPPSTCVRSTRCSRTGTWPWPRTTRARAGDPASIATTWTTSGSWPGRAAAWPGRRKNYVPMIHAAILVAKAPAQYGFEISPEPLLTFDQVPVKDAVDLRVVAECAGTDVGQIQLLNPELRRLATPAGRAWNVKVPTGVAGSASECLANLPPEKRVTFRTNVVARGQTLSSLGKLYGSSPAAIADANGFAVGKRLAKGTELIIPIDPRSAPVRRVAST